VSARLDLQRPMDLLRESRRELGLPELEQVRLGQRRALLQGGLLGAGLVLLVGVVGLGLQLRHQWVSAEQERARLVEAKVTSLENDLLARRAQLQKLGDANQNLAKALAATPSGAALMRELQLRVPEGIQLTAMKPAGATGISLEGLAQGSAAFVRINALLLELERSVMLREPRLEKASRNPPDANEAPGQVVFAIRATLADLASAPALASSLRNLGADGQLRRLLLLRQERLLP
jgi:type IV pilus assembly protein PilN